jgi:hypothetical protein
LSCAVLPTLGSRKYPAIGQGKILPTDPWVLSTDIFIMTTKKIRRYIHGLTIDKMFLTTSKKYPWILPTTVGFIHGYFIMTTGPADICEKNLDPNPNNVRLFGP